MISFMRTKVMKQGMHEKDLRNAYSLHGRDRFDYYFAFGYIIYL